MTGSITVAAVDDHPIVRDGLAGWLLAEGADLAPEAGGITVVATAPTVAALLSGPGRAAQVVLLDLDLRDGTTVERKGSLTRKSFVTGARGFQSPGRFGELSLEPSHVVV